MADWREELTGSLRQAEIRASYGLELVDGREALVEPEKSSYEIVPAIVKPFSQSPPSGTDYREKLRAPY